MNFKCPYCGNSSFKIERDPAGAQLAKCSKCNKTTPFEKQQMTNPRMEPNASRKLHLKYRL